MWFNREIPHDKILLFCRNFCRRKINANGASVAFARKQALVNDRDSLEVLSLGVSRLWISHAWPSDQILVKQVPREKSFVWCMVRICYFCVEYLHDVAVCLFDTCRGNQISPDASISLCFHQIGKEKFIYAVCRDHKLRMWSCKVRVIFLLCGINITLID